MCVCICVLCMHVHCLCVLVNDATWVQSDAMPPPAGKGLCMCVCASIGLWALVWLIEWVSAWVLACSVAACVCVKQVPLCSSFCESRPPWRVFCPFLLPPCQSTSVSLSLFSFYLIHPLYILSRHLSLLSPLLPFCLLKWKNSLGGHWCAQDNQAILLHVDIFDQVPWKTLQSILLGPWISTGKFKEILPLVLVILVMDHIVGQGNICADGDEDNRACGYKSSSLDQSVGRQILLLLVMWVVKINTNQISICEHRQSEDWPKFW